MKVLQAGSYWSSLFKDAYTMCKQCNKCQRLGKIFYRHMMPLNPILVVELWDHFILPLDILTFSWELTMCLSGSKQCGVEQ